MSKVLPYEMVLSITMAAVPRKSDAVAALLQLLVAATV